MASFLTEPVHFKYLSAESFTPPAGSVTDASVVSNAALADTKLQHRYNLTLSQTGAVVAATQYLRVVAATGAVLAVEAAITETIATGGDRTVTIDLKKSTGAGAFATVLTGTIQFTNASVLRTISTGTISSSALADGDILQLTVAVAGAAGAQAAGLVVSVTIRENAQ